MQKGTMPTRKNLADSRLTERNESTPDTARALCGTTNPQFQPPNSVLPNRSGRQMSFLFGAPRFPCTEEGLESTVPRYSTQHVLLARI